MRTNTTTRKPLPLLETFWMLLLCSSRNNVGGNYLVKEQSSLQLISETATDTGFHTDPDSRQKSYCTKDDNTYHECCTDYYNDLCQHPGTVRLSDGAVLRESDQCVTFCGRQKLTTVCCDDFGGAGTTCTTDYNYLGRTRVYKIVYNSNSYISLFAPYTSKDNDNNNKEKKTCSGCVDGNGILQITGGKRNECEFGQGWLRMKSGPAECNVGGQQHECLDGENLFHLTIANQLGSTIEGTSWTLAWMHSTSGGSGRVREDYPIGTIAPKVATHSTCVPVSDCYVFTIHFSTPTDFQRIRYSVTIGGQSFGREYNEDWKTKSEDGLFDSWEFGTSCSDQLSTVGDSANTDDRASMFISAGSGMGGGAIAGIIVAVLAVAVGGCLAYWYYMQRQKGDRDGALESAVDDESEEMNEYSSLATILGWVTFGATWLSWVFVVASTGSCAFLLPGEADQNTSERQTSFGLYNYRISGGSCIRYNDDFDDILSEAGMKTGRTFAIMTCLLLSAALVMAIALKLFLPRFRSEVRVALHFTIFASLWTQLFVFFATATDSCHGSSSAGMQIDCKLGGAGIVAAFNVVLLAALTVLSFFVELERKPILDCSELTKNTKLDAWSSKAQEKQEQVVQEVEETESPESLEVGGEQAGSAAHGDPD